VLFLGSRRSSGLVNITRDVGFPVLVYRTSVAIVNLVSEKKVANVN
jgi:hypothetical protein